MKWREMDRNSWENDQENRPDSLFEKELLAVVKEQQDLLVEYKEQQERRMFEITGKLSGELRKP